MVRVTGNAPPKAIESDMKEIYLDNAATTKPLPNVVAAMAQAMGEGFGNASSLHRRGVRAAGLVREAQTNIEELVGHGPWRVIFTSGGTESDTMAILGSVPRGKRAHVVTSTLEHAAVETSCNRLQDQGYPVTFVSGGHSKSLS